MNRTSDILSFVLRLTTVVAAVWGTALCTFDPTAFMGGKAAWLYFTIQSNIWIALCLFIGLVFQLLRRQPGRWYGVVQLVCTVSIVLTGFVFCFILAPTIDGPVFGLNNLLTHVVAPVAALLDYLLVCRSFTLRKTDALYALLPPLYYLIFAAVGYVLRWPFAPDCCYPYFFLDWGSPAGAFGFCDQLPFMGVMYYVVITLLVLYALARGLVAVSYGRPTGVRS